MRDNYIVSFISWFTFKLLYIILCIFTSVSDQYQNTYNTILNDFSKCLPMLMDLL